MCSSDLRPEFAHLHGDRCPRKAVSRSQGRELCAQAFAIGIRANVPSWIGHRVRFACLSQNDGTCIGIGRKPRKRSACDDAADTTPPEDAHHERVRSSKVHEQPPVNPRVAHSGLHRTLRIPVGHGNLVPSISVHGASPARAACNHGSMPAPYKDAARRRALGARADLPREDLPRLIEYSRDADPRVRTWAVNEMCPCDLRMDVPAVWDRLIEMVADPDVKVRSHVLHVLCDGSPRGRVNEVVGGLETLAHDSDVDLRRRARKVLAHYRRTGRVNIL